VDDLCQAILLALGSEVSGEVFQIATGTETSIIELTGMVQQAIDQDVEMRHGLPRQGDIRKNYSAIAKVRRMLDWYPQVELEEGLRQVWTWFNVQVGGMR
jgi:UDP-glucose 4-epimerase